MSQPAQAINLAAADVDALDTLMMPQVSASALAQAQDLWEEETVEVENLHYYLKSVGEFLKTSQDQN